MLLHGIGNARTYAVASEVVPDSRCALTTIAMWLIAMLVKELVPETSAVIRLYLQRA